MNMNSRHEVQRARVRTKVNVGVDIILNDGTTLSGSVFIGLNERVQDLLNDPKTFIPLRQQNGEILLINKNSIAVCKPLDTPG
ncbi:MAG: hypothetical protein PVF65_04360 [Sphingomonadales bacterium]|jgi:hypothetical protein